VVINREMVQGVDGHERRGGVGSIARDAINAAHNVHTAGQRIAGRIDEDHIITINRGDTANPIAGSGPIGVGACAPIPGARSGRCRHGNEQHAKPERFS